MSEDKKYIIEESGAEIIEKIRMLEHRIRYLEKIINDLRNDISEIEGEIEEMKNDLTEVGKLIIKPPTQKITEEKKGNR